MPERPFALVRRPAETLAEGIVTGHPDMPVVAFDESQVASVVAYLRSLDQ
mgnify:CR=1 FL=1